MHRERSCQINTCRALAMSGHPSMAIAKGFLAVYPSRMLENISLRHIVDSPFAWGFVGFILGLALGVTTLSVWLVALGLGLFLLYMRLHGPVQQTAEGRLFIPGPAFMMSWVLGFIVRGLVF